MLGTGRRRLEGEAKVRGETPFAGDHSLPGLAHARLVLSPHAAARVLAVDASAALAMPGVLAVVTAGDLAGVPLADLCLLRDRTSFAGQPVAAVLAESEAAAADAAARVNVDYEVLPAVVDAEAALAPDAPAVLEGRPNQTDHDLMELGLTAGALAGCAVVVEGSYRLPPVQQAPLEPHVAIAAWRSRELTVWTPTQSLFVTQQVIAAALGLPISSVRVVPAPVGGGFGGKLGVLLEPLAAWLTRASGRPVRLALTRTEEFLLSGRATGCSIDLRLGAAADGLLQGLDARVVVDQGAGPGFPAHRVGAFLTRPYLLPAYRVDCTGAMTNSPPANAYRGQPAALACFALESAMDELARRLDLDPIDLRLRNLRPEGAPDPAGGRWPRVGGRECLEAARPLLAALGPGSGVAYGVWDGYEGAAAAGCRLNPDGSLTVQVGTPDISGSHTALAMIAADAFQLPLERVTVELGDSAGSPQGPAAGGSAVTYVLGGAVAAAAEEARTQLLEVAAEELEAAPEDLEIEAAAVRVRGAASRSLTIGELAAAVYGWHSHHRPVHGHARTRAASASPMATVHVATVDLDSETGEWRVTGYASVQDVGRALNPDEVAAQVHGGAVQGLGRALGEELLREATGAATDSFLTYEVPTIDVAPEIAVELVEVPSAEGGLGVRGAGEPPIIPGPAAIANALARAGGVRLRRLPFTMQEVARASAKLRSERA